METLEMIGLIPVLYLAIKGIVQVWNEDREADYDAHHAMALAYQADGQKDKAQAEMDKANLALRFIIRSKYL